MQHEITTKEGFWVDFSFINQESQAALMNYVIWLLWLCSRARLYSDFSMTSRFLPQL